MDVRNIAEVAAVFRALNPKVVFTQLDSTNIGGAIAAFVADIPGVVMSFRNYNPTHFPQWARALAVDGGWVPDVGQIATDSIDGKFSGSQ